VFEAYATVELTGTGHHKPIDLLAEWDGHDRAVLEMLRRESPIQPWWLGFLETGCSDVVFPSAPRTMLYASWRYVLVETGPEQAGTWRQDGGDEDLPDLMSRPIEPGSSRPCGTTTGPAWVARGR
jgi:hypothetical protein